MNFKRKRFSKNDYFETLKNSRSWFFEAEKKDQKNYLKKLEIFTTDFSEIREIKKIPTNRETKKGLDYFLNKKNKNIEKQVIFSAEKKIYDKEIKKIVVSIFGEIKNWNVANTTDTIYFNYQNKKIRLSSHLKDEGKYELKKKSFNGILKALTIFDFDYELIFYFWENIKDFELKKTVKNLFIKELKELKIKIGLDNRKKSDKL